MTIGKWAAILTMTAVVAGGATSASADSFDFTSCHIANGCGPAPFGTATLTQNGANVDVSVTGPNFIFFASTGAVKGGDGVFFAFNGTGITAADIVNETATAPGTPPTLQGVAGSFSVNGQPDFGTFGFAIECATCSGTSDQVSKISFTVDNATIADLTAPNGAGVRFIADVLVNGGTGVVDVSVPAPIVGAGLPGVVLACGGLLGLARRRRQRIA